MNKDFLTITPESGGGGTTDVTVQASQNSDQVCHLGGIM